jgi:hypothetical protein
MAAWRLCEGLLSGQCPRNVRRWHFSFLRQSVNEHDGVPTVEEIQHPILPPANWGAQLVDAFAYVVCNRSTQFVTVIAQQVNSRNAFFRRTKIAPRHILQPLDNRHGAVRFAVVENFRGRHADKYTTKLLYCQFMADLG